jgi:hypothetical protein
LVVLWGGVVFTLHSSAASQSQPTDKAAAATNSQGAKVPRTVDGQPDLQGVWNYASVTPLERPAELGNKAIGSAEEIQKLQSELNKDFKKYEETNLKTSYAPEVWYEVNRNLPDKRTSLIVDPSNGRLPPMVPQTDKTEWMTKADNPEDRTLAERCILGFASGPPMIPGIYNSNVQVIQTKTHVVLLNEMIHDARIIPTDGRPHGTLRSWAGDSTGKWDGNTLVIDTVNFRPQLRVNKPTNVTVQPSEQLHLTERFTRTGPNTMTYEFTVNDPGRWTRSWSAMIPMNLGGKTDLIYEYACHEGNYGLPNILKAARSDEHKNAGTTNNR